MRLGRYNPLQKDSGAAIFGKPARLPNASFYNLRVTAAAGGSRVRDRLYHAYASQHASFADIESAGLVYRCYIRPLLPSPANGPVADIGCGQGQLVRLLSADGYDAFGVDISPEQVAIARAAGLDRVYEGHYDEVLRSHQDQLAAVTATDLLEHLTKDEVFDTFELVHAALKPNGVFVARVPNAVSPIGGHIRYGDFTHETWFTARSIMQLAAATGFRPVTVHACSPIAHGVISMARVAAWKPLSGLFKIALAAETGVLRGHIVTQNLTFAANKQE